MNITRVWAMPNKNTFSIKPISKLIKKYLNGKSVDPFANSNRYATITNDLDTQYDTDFNEDAIDFLGRFDSGAINVVLFDPPYSARQVSESYKKMGMAVNMETTQGSFWRKLKQQIERITTPGGVVISCGWNSGGIGAKYGFELIEILLVPHGGAHNDTIVTVERRISENQVSMEI